ncbi:alpha/beta hydrolase [Ancylobacter dichloromethanicus]
MAPAAGGAPWRIFLYRPPGEPPAQGWPALFYLDANAVAGTAADIMRVQAAYPLGTGVEWGVMVGIGYPSEGAYDSARRSWDMGPPPGETYPPHTPDGPEVRTGGADGFLAFIEDELKPEIARRVALDPSRQAILGHSFGGLFVLHALFRRPQAFAHWISASPAIWWEGAGIIGSAEAFVAAGTRASGRLLLLAGEYEQKLAPFQIGAPDAGKRLAGFEESRIVDNTRLMAARLAGVPGLTTEYIPVSGETHMSVLPASVNLAIRFAFGPPA